MQTSSPSSYKFGIFEVDLVNREVRKRGLRVKLQEQPFQILEMLLGNAGQIVSREQIRAKLWPADTFVDFDHSLNTAINRLREVLGDSADDPKFIETLPRRGYRFIGAVEGNVSASGEDELKLPPVATSSGKSRPEVRRFMVPASLVVAVAVMIALIWIFWPKKTIDSIAVLPFANNTGNPELEYLSDGLSESVINNLAQAPRLKVMSRNSVFHYKGREIDSRKIGRELGVRGVLLGSLQKRDEGLVVSIELIDTSDNRHVWGEQYVRNLSDTLSLQEEISRQVAERLRVKLTGETEKRVTKHYTENNEAYQLYLRGQYQLGKRTTEGFRNGAEFFRQAIEKDPTYALAYVGLSSSYGLLKFYGGIAPREALPKQIAATTMALELDDSLAEVHSALGFLKDSEWDTAGSEREFKRAIELNQNSATAHHGYSMLLDSLGRSEEALEQNRRVQELDPLWPGGMATQVSIYVHSRDYDKAIPAALRSIAFDPNFPPAHWTLGFAYEAKGNYKAAIQEFQRAEELFGDSIIPRAMLGHGYAVAGDKTKALKIAQELQTTGEHTYVSSYNIAAIYAGLSDKEKAFAWLARAFESNDPWLAHLKTDSRFDGLHSDPRYAELLKKTGRAN